jgi:hypothetical protein
MVVAHDLHPKTGQPVKESAGLSIELIDGLWNGLP